MHAQQAPVQPQPQVQPAKHVQLPGARVAGMLKVRMAFPPILFFPLFYLSSPALVLHGSLSATKCPSTPNMYAVDNAVVKETHKNAIDFGLHTSSLNTPM